jgi:hypothetical protein
MKIKDTQLYQTPFSNSPKAFETLIQQEFEANFKIY